MRTYNYINFFKRKKFLKIVFLYFLVLIVIMATSSFLIYKIYENQKKADLKSDYISNLSALAGNIDNSFNELQYTSFLLSSDSNLYDIFYSEDRTNTSGLYQRKATIDTLVKFKATKNIIDSVYVLRKASNEVLDTYGTYYIDNFYSKNSVYEKYNREFWMNFKVRSSYYQILEPSALETISSGIHYKRDVIPFVTSNIESFKSENLLVINISEHELINLLNKYKLLLSSKLFIVNQKGVVIACTEENSKKAASTDNIFLSKILSSKSNFFDYTINGSKTLVVTYTSNSKLNNFTYVAIIPYCDFNKNLADIEKFTFIITFLSVMLSTFLAYMMSRKIYSPIKNLIGIFNKDQNDSYLSGIGEIDYLNSQVKRVLSNEDSLKKDLSLALPLAWEQYLTKIFTNNDFLLDESVKNFIQNNHVDFKYTGFCVSIVELNFTEKYHKLYSADEYTTLLKGITKLLNDILLDDYPTYIISLTKGRLGVLINLPENESLDHICSKLKSVIELFDYDRDLLTFAIGMGRVYSNYIGINQSYNEALKALNSLSPLGSDRLRLYTETTNNFRCHYSINDENKLYNYLVGCYKEEALSFMKLLIQKFYQGNPSEAATKKFYFNIYNTILRIIEEKNFDLPTLMGQNYIDIPSNIEILSITDFNTYLFSLADKLLSVNNNSTKVDILQITEYIKNHYHEDIYLEKVSGTFNTSASYLSRLFKESLGVCFHEYLTSLRVTKSKALLLESDISVTEIGKMVGFNTYSTFFRIFRKSEGVNPTQYRINQKGLKGAPEESS